jgi:hypothetical protein
MKPFDEVIKEICGKRAWRARKGVGTYVLIEFGEKQVRGTEESGEYSIWIRGAPWRLDEDGKILAGSGQEELSTASIDCLNGDFITSIRAEPPYFDIVLGWQSGRRLHVFCENEEPSWSTLIFFTPVGTYGFGSSGKISFEAD